MTGLLDEKAVETELRTIPGWTRQGPTISRRFQFRDFRESMAFVNRLAELAESANHHPDITINWNRVSLTLTTHSEKGLTAKDFALARKIDAALV